MIIAIVTSHKNWFCKTCNDNHNILYIDGNFHYCKNCLPQSVRDKGIRYYNQNREPIEFKED